LLGKVTGGVQSITSISNGVINPAQWTGLQVAGVGAGAAGAGAAGVTALAMSGGNKQAVGPHTERLLEQRRAMEAMMQQRGGQPA